MISARDEPAALVEALRGRVTGHHGDHLVADPPPGQFRVDGIEQPAPDAAAAHAGRDHQPQHLGEATGEGVGVIRTAAHTYHRVPDRPSRSVCDDQKALARIDVAPVVGPAELPREPVVGLHRHGCDRAMVVVQGQPEGLEPVDATGPGGGDHQVVVGRAVSMRGISPAVGRAMPGLRAAHVPTAPRPARRHADGPWARVGPVSARRRRRG